MRVAGIYALHSQSPTDLFNKMAELLDPGGRHDTEEMAFPTEHPRIKVLTAKEGNPAVQVARRPDGSFAIVDGEIYSPEGLSVTRDSKNAAKMILGSYFTLGQEAIERLDAAAAITIWDAPNEILLVFRDRFGQGLSFYSELPVGVAWSSDIGSLLRLGAPSNIYLPALDFFLGNGRIPEPWTLAGGVKRIPAGHVLSVSRDGRAKLRRYWRPVGQPKIRLNAKETNERAGELFKQSLHRRVSPDIRTGVLLSSGIDSTLIVAVLRKMLNASFDTFTFRYDEYDGNFNEVDQARASADYFGVKHHELIFRPSDIPNNLDWMVRSYGEPFTYPLCNFMMQGVATHGVSVLLQGSPQLFPHIDRFNVYGLRYARLPSIIQKLGEASIPALQRLNASTRPSWARRLYTASGKFATFAERVIWCSRTGRPADLAFRIIRDELRPSYYSDPSWVPEARRATDELFESVAGSFPGENDRDKITFMRGFLRGAPDENRYHWWGRAHGLAIRAACLDADLQEFVTRLPSVADPEKRDARRFGATLMPKEFAYRPRLGHGVPISDWFRGPLKEFLQDQLAPSRLKESGLFNVNTVQKAIKEHIEGKNNHGWKLWSILTVLVWHELASRRDL